MILNFGEEIGGFSLTDHRYLEGMGQRVTAGVRTPGLVSPLIVMRSSPKRRRVATATG
jgi:hypothetical protein